MLLKTLLLAELACLTTLSALPILEPFETEIKNYFNNQRSTLKVLLTTTTPKGQVIDWVDINSQGSIANPPPDVEAPHGPLLATPELGFAQAKLGPRGSVPILRQNLDGISFDRPLETFLSKSPGAKSILSLNASSIEAKQSGGTHRYGASQQRIENWGTRGTLNIWNPYTRTKNEFSLMQNAIINNEQGYSQTVESGWQRYQGLYGDTSSHLFTFSDNVGGYNRNVKGWIQYSSSIFPGTIFTPTSSADSQHEIPLQWQYWQGNWWLKVMNQWVGYYPGSLFAKNKSVDKTLGTKGTYVAWYGEVYDDQTNVGGKTTTDMGSGEFPSTGHAAYMNYLAVQTNYDGAFADYDGNIITQDSSDMYQIQTHWKSGSQYGSFAYLGGPGSG